MAALVALEARGNAVPEPDFPAASGCPILPTRGQIQHSAIEKTLTEIGLIGKSNNGGGDEIFLCGMNASSARRKAAVIVKNIVLSAMRSWIINAGFSSTNTLRIRTDGSPLPQFGQFRWDFVGPTYLSGLKHYSKGVPVNGFVVGDILLDTQISKEMLRPFMAKWACLEGQRRATRFLPFFIADNFQEDALQELRSKGCVIARPDTIFGKDAANHLQELVSTLTNAAAAVVSDPASLFTLISKISKIEGAALNLRGVVLELMIAHTYRQKGYEIDIRQQITSEQNEKAEIDIRGMKGQTTH